MNISKIQSYLEKHHPNIQWCHDYCEPGYSLHNDRKGILFGNWNDVPKKLADVLETIFELEWEDEWTTCCDCGKAIRTSPNCYSWTSSYRIVNECEILCLDCLDFGEYLESIENDPCKACPPECNPADYGYEKYNGTFETGLHPGQTDDPKKVLELLPNKRVIFKIAEQSQFYVTWECWVKSE